MSSTDVRSAVSSRSFTVHHAGLPIHVTEMGTNEPALVLLSGLGDPAFWWFAVPTPEEGRPHWRGSQEHRAGIAPALASVTRVIAYDRAGVGGSAVPDHERTWPELYAELEAVLSASGLTRPPVLVGHSLGGMIAYTYARRHLSAIAGLVLLDVTPPPTEPRPHGASPERLALTHFEAAEVSPDAIGDLPLVLVSPGRAATAPETGPGTATTQKVLDVRFRRRREQHERLLTTSTRSRAVWTPLPGHYVHLETPEVVISATLQLWEEARTHS